MRQDQYAGQPFDRLNCKRPLSLQINSASIASGQEIRMRLGLRQPTFGARQFLVDVRRRTADLLVRSLDQFGQRQFHVIAHPIDLGQAILARLIEKRRQGLLLQPTGRLRQRGDGRRGGRRVRRAQIARRKTRSKQKRPRRTAFNFLIFLEEIWSGQGIRTLDPNLGKVAIISAATSRLPTPFCGGRPSPPISENTVLITVLNLRLERCGSRNLLKLLARPKRFELLTPKFVVWCSIQLSYGR